MESVQERVAKRAYELFEARGGQHGYHIEDWLQAENEVSNSIAAVAKPKKQTVKKTVEKDTAVKTEKKPIPAKKKMAVKK